MLYVARWGVLFRFISCPFLRRVVRRNVQKIVDHILQRSQIYTVYTYSCVYVCLCTCVYLCVPVCTCVYVRTRVAFSTYRRIVYCCWARPTRSTHAQRMFHHRPISWLSLPPLLTQHPLRDLKSQLSWNWLVCNSNRSNCWYTLKKWVGCILM